MDQIQETTMQYHILLFTMWEEPGAWPLARSGWRFSLQDPHTLQRIGFQSLAELCSYLQQRTALTADVAEDNLSTEEVGRV